MGQITVRPGAVSSRNGADVIYHLRSPVTLPGSGGQQVGDSWLALRAT